jgi:hypothetical protein
LIKQAALYQYQSRNRRSYSQEGVVIVEYTNTLEHIEHFAKYHINRSKYGQILKYVLRLLIPVIFIVLIILDAVSERIDPIPIIVFTAISVAWFFISPSVLQRSLMKQMKKIYERDIKKGSLLPKRIMLDKHGITEEIGNISIPHTWESITRVVFLEHYIIIYLSALDAQIIPLDSIPGDDMRRELAAILKNYCSESIINETYV